MTVPSPWKNVKKLSRLPYGEKVMIIEGLLFLFAARVTLRIIPFKRIAQKLGRHMWETPTTNHLQNKEAIHTVRRTLDRLSGKTLWETTCLTRAMAGKVMLNRRGIACTLYFGLAKETTENNGLKAHAWLRSGNSLITGGGNLSSFTVVSLFGDKER